MYTYIRVNTHSVLKNGDTNEKYRIPRSVLNRLQKRVIVSHVQLSR